MGLTLPGGGSGGSSLASIPAFRPENYGAAATYNAGTDDTTAVQAAVTAAVAAGGTVFLSRWYNVTNVTVTGQISIVGTGSYYGSFTKGSGLRCNTATSEALTISADACTLTDFGMVNASGSTPTAGTGVRFTRGDESHLTRLTVVGFYDGIRYDGGNYYTLADCRVYDPVRYGMYFRNVISGQFDHGDQGITGCVITSMYHAYNASAAVRWESGGGLKFIGNKINGGGQVTIGGTGALGGGGKFAVGLDAAIADAVSTVDLHVVGNSIENCTTALLQVHQAGPNYTGNNTVAGYFGNVVISANEFGYGAAGVQVFGQSETGHIRSVLVDANVFTNLSGDAIWSQYTDGLTIGQNTFETISGTIVNFGANVLGASVANQNARQDNLTLFVDGTLTGNGNNNGPHSRVDHRYAREAIGVTSTAVYATQFSFDVAQYGSGSLDLYITGQIEGVGSSHKRVSRYFFRDGGAVTLGTIGTDVGGASQTPDINFDTTTTSGRVYVQVKLPSASGGVQLHGKVVLALEGSVSRVRRGTG